jgi:hypothetical protein
MIRALQEPRFSVDICLIKAYYSIVRMGKAPVASAGHVTKTEFALSYGGGGFNAKARRPSAARPNQNEEGGWKRPEISQGNRCQGNNPENAFLHSLDKHSPDFVFFQQLGGPAILSDMRDVDGLQCRGAKAFHSLLLASWRWNPHADWGLGRIAPADVSPAAESRPSHLIIQYSIHLLCFMISSLQASLFSPCFTIFDENQPK